MNKYNYRYNSRIRRSEQSVPHNEPTDNNSRQGIRILSTEEIGEPYIPRNAGTYYAYGNKHQDTINQDLYQQRDVSGGAPLLKQQDKIMAETQDHNLNAAHNEENTLHLRKRVMENSKVIGNPIPLPYLNKKHINRETQPLTNQRHGSGVSSMEHIKHQSAPTGFPNDYRASNPHVEDDETAVETTSTVPYTHPSGLDLKVRNRNFSRNVSRNIHTHTQYNEYTIKVNNNEDLVTLWESIVEIYNMKKKRTKDTDHPIENSPVQKNPESLPSNDQIPLNQTNINKPQHQKPRILPGLQKVWTFLVHAVFKWDTLVLTIIIMTLLIYNRNIYFMYRET